MDQSNRSSVVSLRSRAQDRSEKRATAAVYRYLRDAASAIDMVLAGDIDMIFTADQMVNKATRITMANGLSTHRRVVSIARCRLCGADVSQGRCWGCGAPPEAS